MHMMATHTSPNYRNGVESNLKITLSIAFCLIRLSFPHFFLPLQGIELKLGRRRPFHFETITTE